MPLLLWLLACSGGPSVPDPADRAAYLAAAKGGGDCAAIADASWQAECHTFAASALADEGDADGAAAHCEAIDETLWQEECRFLVADELGLSGAEAAAACDTTGRFERDCVSHALVRDLRAAEKAHGALGEEVEWQREIEALAGHYAAEPDDETGYVLFVHQLAHRMGPEPFTELGCGAATDEACRDAYLVALSATPMQVDLAGACGGERTPSSLAKRGVRPYREGSERVAQMAFEVMCRVVDTGENPRMLGALLNRGAPSLPMGSYLAAPAPWMPAGQRRSGPPGRQRRPRGAR